MSPELRLKVDDDGVLRVEGIVPPHDRRLRHIAPGRDHRLHTWRCASCGLDYVGAAEERPAGPCLEAP